MFTLQGRAEPLVDSEGNNVVERSECFVLFSVIYKYSYKWPWNTDPGK